MIDQRQHIGRTRPYPLPTVLNAIAHTLKRPGADLPEVRQMNWPTYVSDGGADLTALDEFPAAMLRIEKGSVAGLVAWAAVLSNVRVEVWADAQQTTISVIGRTSSGPVLSVYDTVSDWPLDAIPGKPCTTITADELGAVADSVRSGESLAGAR